MRVLQIAQSVGAGGAERLVVGLCNRLSASDADEVVLLTIRDERDSRNVHYLKDLSPKVRFINLHCKSGLQLKAFWGVFQTIRKERPDVVHSHFSPILLFLPALILRKPSYFFTIHSMAERIVAHYNFLKRTTARYLFRTNRVKPITISQACHQSYHKAYHLDNDVCITNGCEPLQTTSRSLKVKEEIDKLKQNAETVVFIHVARNSKPKNHERLFHTFLQLEKENADFLLIVLGDKYEPWTDKLKDSRKIRLLGVKDNVGDYMAVADYFVLSSDWEGLPITLLEAMSMGVIPISTPAGGIVDVIKDGENGYITKGFDDDEFYQKVRQILNGKGSVSTEKVKQDYQKNYSMESCATKYYEQYKIYDSIKRRPSSLS